MRRDNPMLITSGISALMWLQVYIVAGLPETAQKAIGGLTAAINLAAFTTFIVGGIIGPCLYFVDRWLRQEEAKNVLES
jgi:hypothetical protein